MNLATLAEKNLAEFGEYDRLVFEGRSYSNRLLHDRSASLSTALAAIGLSPGDRVVVLLPNCPDVFVAYAGIWRAGLAVIPVLFLLEATELRYVIENSRARAIVTSEDFLGKVETALAHVKEKVKVIVIGPEERVAPPNLSLERLIAEQGPSKIVERERGDAATILYTSGTTGNPKGVVQTHGSLLANVANVWSSGTRTLGLVNLLALPLAHTFGLSALIGGYMSGGKSILMRWFDAEKALALIEEHQVARMAGVPTMFVYMMNLPNREKYDVSSMKHWLVAAAPMPVEQLRRFEATFGGVMYVGYGLTECPSVAGEREDIPRKAGSTGVPISGVEVRILDEQGSPLETGHVGEICVRGDNVSAGYFENTGASTDTFRDGWLHTGDMGYLDEENYLFIVDRKKDLIIRGGFNVYPKDVEEVLYRHPKVREAAVVGVPDDNMGEEVCACVVKHEGAELTAQEVMLHCQSSLAKYKTPRYVEFVDALPKNTIGKIQKRAVRALVMARLGLATKTG